MGCIGTVNKNKYLYVLMDPRKEGPFYFSELGMTFSHYPFYVGIGNNKRWLEHNKEAINEAHNIGNIGKKGRIRKIIEEGMIPLVWISEKISKNTAILLERVFIQLLGRINLKTGCLFNLTDGGEYFEGWIATDEYRRKMSELMTGSKNGFYGKKHTDEVKKRLSEIRKNTTSSQKTRDKISKAIKGRHHSEETKRKIRESNKGKQHPAVSEETKKKISDSLRGRPGRTLNKKFSTEERLKMGNYWRIIDPLGNEQIIQNLSYFCQQNGLTQTGMYYVSRGICSHHKGYKCYKLEDVK
jgi:hypothetical protein